MMKVLFVLSFVIAVVTANSAFYDDIFARQLLSIAAGGFSAFPEICLKKTFVDSGWAFYPRYVYRVYNAKIKGNLTYYALINEDKRQIIAAFAAHEPSDEDSLTGLLKYNDPIDFKNYGSVNRLFSDLEEQIWPFVHQLLAFKDYLTYSVTFTGYSVGGAVATLAAMQTVSDNLRDSSHVTLMQRENSTRPPERTETPKVQVEAPDLIETSEPPVSPPKREEPQAAQKTFNNDLVGLMTDPVPSPKPQAPSAPSPVPPQPSPAPPQGARDPFDVFAGNNTAPMRPSPISATMNANNGPRGLSPTTMGSHSGAYGAQGGFNPMGSGGPSPMAPRGPSGMNISQMHMGMGQPQGGMQQQQQNSFQGLQWQGMGQQQQQQPQQQRNPNQRW